MTVNKMDRCFLELMLDGEEAYQNFARVIENANVIMATYADELMGETQVGPEKGTVCFSAGLHNWAFTLTVFSNMYASKFGVEPARMMEKLWGDNFFDPTTKKWTKKVRAVPRFCFLSRIPFVPQFDIDSSPPQTRSASCIVHPLMHHADGRFGLANTQATGAKTCKRGFVQFCYEPIRMVIDAAMADNKDKLWTMCTKLKIVLKPDDKDLVGKPLMKRVMQTWLPAHVALLEMIIFHLPSPATAQAYRVENLYEGPMDDRYADAMRKCDADGPLMLYVSKMIPAADKGRFFAFGRVFSGTIRTGQKVSRRVTLKPSHLSPQRTRPSLQPHAPPRPSLARA
jgi:elongation factor 2